MKIEITPPVGVEKKTESLGVGTGPATKKEGHGERAAPRVRGTRVIHEGHPARHFRLGPGLGVTGHYLTTPPPGRPDKRRENLGWQEKD